MTKEALPEGNKSCIDILRLLIFSYLYIPIIIFCVTWFKWQIALLVCLEVTIGLGLFLIRSKTSFRRLQISEWIFAGVTLVLIFIWCVLSGFGGYVLQSGDFPKHNVILRDLMVNTPPVRYDFDGREGILSYYIAGYIVPALTGRFFSESFDAAHDALLVWNTAGIFLAVLLLYRNIGQKKGASLIIITLTLILFSTFVCPVSGIFKNWYPDEAGDGIHWLSNTIWIQYSSNVVLLAYVFPQMISGLLGISLLKELRYDYGKWGFILAPLVLYSAFVFLGMAVLMLTVFIADLFPKRGEEGEHNFKAVVFKQIFSGYNLCSLGVMVPLVLYLAGNILQDKPDGVAMGLEFIWYKDYFHTLVFFELSWLLWILLLLKREKGNRLLLAASLNLLIYPLFKMGYYNDFCMRSSIPALLAVCVTVAENIIISIFGEKGKDENTGSERNLWYAVLLSAFLIICGLGPLKETEYFYTGRARGERNYYDPYTSSEEFFFSHDFTEYQYIDWDPESISKEILK